VVQKKSRGRGRGGLNKILEAMQLWAVADRGATGLGNGSAVRRGGCDGRPRCTSGTEV
jgi:hypothetical protein